MEADPRPVNSSHRSGVIKLIPKMTARYFTDSGIAYTQTGDGPALILLHGWPFHADSFRQLIPLLSEHFTCYAIDSVGMGESPYDESTDFSFRAHAKRVIEFVNAMEISEFSLLGHDTGGTIARLVAVDAPERVKQLILLDTEMPGHLPSIVPKYQKILSTSVARLVFSWLLMSKRYARSRFGFTSCFYNKNMITDEFLELFCHYWIKPKTKLNGLIAYLMAIDHHLVDELDEIHKNIKCPTLVLWGENDAIFPVALAKHMVMNMAKHTEFKVIAETGFLVHEERPAIVAKHILNFNYENQIEKGSLKLVGDKVG